MATRAIWKGVIRFGEWEVPVRLHSAVERRGVHFRLLHREDGAPVEQRWFDPEEDEIVPTDQVHRAAVLPDGTLVEVTARDLEEIAPPPRREIEITCFVHESAIEPSYFERPYYLAPDGRTSAHALLTTVLAKKRLAGIARWVMRKKHYLGAVTSDGKYLAVSTLRSAAEVMPARELPVPTGRAAKKKELDLARQLVGSLEAPFDPGAFPDTYTEDLLELVARRAEDHTVRRGERRSAAKTGSLEDSALEEPRAPKAEDTWPEEQEEERLSPRRWRRSRGRPDRSGRA